MRRAEGAKGRERDAGREEGERRVAAVAALTQACRLAVDERLYTLHYVAFARAVILQQCARAAAAHECTRADAVCARVCVSVRAGPGDLSVIYS